MVYYSYQEGMSNPRTYETKFQPNGTRSSNRFLYWYPTLSTGNENGHDSFTFSSEMSDVYIGEPNQPWHGVFKKAYDSANKVGSSITITDYSKQGLKSEKYEIFVYNERGISSSYELELLKSKFTDEEILPPSKSIDSRSQKSDSSKLSKPSKYASSNLSTIVIDNENFIKRLNRDTAEKLIRSLDQKPRDSSNVRWINLVGLEPQAVKLLLNKLKIDAIVAASMFGSTPFQPQFYGAQLSIDIPCFSLDGNRPEKFNNKSFISAASASVLNFTSYPLNYKLSDLICSGPLEKSQSKQLDYSEKDTYYAQQKLSFIAKNPLHSFLKVGKVSIVCLDPNTMFTYCNILGDELEASCLRLLSDPQCSSIVGNPLRPSDIILLVILRCIKSVNEAFGAYQEALLELKVDIIQHASLDNLSKVNSIMSGLEDFKLQVRSFNSIFQAFKTGGLNELFTDKSIFVLQSYERELESYGSGVDALLSECGTLNNLNFNILSYKTNDSLSRLTLTAMVFLPLTFWCSYFSMNFSHFTDIDNHGVSYYWKVAVPVLVLFFILIMWRHLLEFGRTIQRKFGTKVTYMRLKHQRKQIHKMQKPKAEIQSLKEESEPDMRSMKTHSKKSSRAKSEKSVVEEKSKEVAKKAVEKDNDGDSDPDTDTDANDKEGDKPEKKKKKSKKPKKEKPSFDNKQYPAWSNLQLFKAKKKKAAEESLA